MEAEPMSRPSAVFRLSSGRGPWIALSLGMGPDAPLSADIVFRSMQRLGQALAERLDRLRDEGPDDDRLEATSLADAGPGPDRPAVARSNTTVAALAGRCFRRAGLVLGRTGAVGIGERGLATPMPMPPPPAGTGPNSPPRR